MSARRVDGVPALKAVAVAFGLLACAALILQFVGGLS